MIHFKVIVPGSGWFGLGFAYNSSRPVDIIGGGVMENGKGYLMVCCYFYLLLIGFEKDLY